MFAINHAASSLLFKKHLRGEISFVWILLAVQFIELVWVFLNWLGIERVTTEDKVRYVGDIHLSYMPYSHSILSSAILVVIAGIVFWFWKKSVRIIIIIIMLACSSHIILDFVTHARDLPLGFTYRHVLGLGLYSVFPLVAFLLEIGFGLFCWWYYRGDRALFWIILALNVANISLFFPEIPGLEIYLADRPHGNNNSYFCSDSSYTCSCWLEGYAQSKTCNGIQEMFFNLSNVCGRTYESCEPKCSSCIGLLRKPRISHHFLQLKDMPLIIRR